MMDSTKEGKTRLIESSSDSDSETQEMNRDKQAHNVEAALSSSGHRSKSRQTLYYHRITQNREKRSYKPYKQQDQPSRQLRHYYKNKALNTSETSSRVTASHTDVENEDLTSDNESEFIASEELLPQSDDTDFSDSETTETSESSTEGSVDDELEGNENIADVEQEQDEDLLHMPQQVPLYEGSVISRVFACVLVVSFVLRHNLSKAAWADLIRLLSVFVGRQYKGVFQSVYKMKLYLKDYFGTTDPVKVLYCSNCFSQVFDKQCPNQECQGRPLSGFLDLNLEERLKELFRDAEFCKLLKRGKEKIKDTAKRTIYDIYHGLDYKNFLYPGGFLTQEFNISFTINTDGVNKYSSSSAGHLWPVYVMINELPKEYRFKKKYFIPAYIYCDKKEPNMMTFLNPLVEKLNTLHSRGLRVQDSAVGDINVRCMLFVVSADLPARADLMNMKRFNGKCGCHLCKEEGVPYGYNNLHRAWPYREGMELRSHEDQLDFASRANQTNTAVMGVKGYSVFAKLHYRFDVVRSHAVDWMHCVALGVVKYLMNLMTSNKWNESHFYIGSKLATLSTRLVSIRPPENIGRLPRSLGELQHWKATELKNWLLHYSVPVLQSTLNPLCLLHWCLMTLNHSSADYKLQAFARFEDINSPKFDSMAYTKAGKTDSTVIEFLDKQGKSFFARIKFFLKAGNIGICVCHLLEIVQPDSNPFSVSERCLESIPANNISISENHKKIIERIVKKYRGKHVVQHQTCVKPQLGKVTLINTHQIVRKCVFIDFSSEYWIVSKFPNIIEHN